ncbi:hypothetical protein EDD22DRAFT_787811 [Suillus occidentalis]|nr:hypothetical protein EDD22DRAFT_787811 [Suillus occidentalis]
MSSTVSTHGDLGISAFLGDTIYNFGELLMHPILDALDNTQYDWIKKLLFTSNEGNGAQ